MTKIAKQYNPSEIELRWAREWVEKRLFEADAASSKPMFSLVIPPPNVTGSLHMGHMLEHTEIDIIIRWKRVRWPEVKKTLQDKGARSFLSTKRG